MIPIGFWFCAAIVVLGSFALSWMGIRDYQRTESAAQKNSFVGLGEGLLRLHQERVRAEKEPKKQASSAEAGKKGSSTQTVGYLRANPQQFGVAVGYPGQPPMSVEVTGTPWPLTATIGNKLQPIPEGLVSLGPLQVPVQGLLLVQNVPGAPNQDGLVVPVQISALKPNGDEPTSGGSSSTI